MSTNVKKRITVRELREHPERYPHIAQVAEPFKPLVARFLARSRRNCASAGSSPKPRLGVCAGWSARGSDKRSGIWMRGEPRT